MILFSILPWSWPEIASYGFSVHFVPSSLLPRVPFFHLTKAGVTLTAPLKCTFYLFLLEAVDTLHNSESFL